MAGVRIAQKRYQIIEDDIAGEQYMIRNDVHRQVTIGMGGAEQGDDKLHIAQAETRALAQVLVGRYLLESLYGLIRLEIFVRPVRGENLGIQVGEYL